VGDDSSAVARNHKIIYDHLELTAQMVATPHQVHSNRVEIVSKNGTGETFRATDGLATATPGIALFLRFADCQPILLYDPIRHALALAHAGWRGVAQGVAYRAVEAMQDAFGTDPGDLIAGLGPAIGPCHYTVGDKVAAAMGYALPDWSQAMQPQGKDWSLDLSAANAQQLAAKGVQQIEHACLCTACHNDIFFSHRADGGQTGRFAAVAFLKPRDMGQASHDATESTVDPDRSDPAEPESLNPPGFPAFGEWHGDET
jgi:YfiH family protein